MSPSPGLVVGLRLAPSSPASGFRREVIVVAVRWYLRTSLSYRDVEELLAKHWRGVDNVTVYRQVQRFNLPLAGARFESSARQVPLSSNRAIDAATEDYR